MKSFNWLVLFFPCLFVVDAGQAAIIVDLPGYSAAPFANALPYGDALTIDGSGQLYAPSWSEVTRFAPNGTPSTWSGAIGGSLVLATDGSGYLATGGLSHSILKLSLDGSFGPLVPSSSALEWTSLALSPSGNLFANIAIGAGQGLYSINTATGAYAPIVLGSPGSSATEVYRGMTFGADGKLYAIGNDFSTNALYRLDGSTFSAVASLPYGGIGLAVDPSGVFYTAATSGGVGSVWRIDLAAGTTEQLASGFNDPAGIAVDPASGTLYVRDQSSPFQITAITVPEPSTVTLVAAAGFFIGAARRRRRRD